MWFKAIFALCIGLAVTAGICTASAWIITSATGLVNPLWWWGIWVLTFVVLIFVNQVVNTLKQNSTRITEAIEQAEQTKYQTLQGVECYICKALNDVPVVISDSNSFDCASCGKKNRMLFATKTCSPGDQSTTFSMDAEILRGNISS